MLPTMVLSAIATASDPEASTAFVTLVMVLFDTRTYGLDWRETATPQPEMLLCSMRT